ncbi:MAG: glycosyltransferase [Bacteroidota bacterium]
MRYRKHLEIESFFDVSIIMPFYRRLSDFTRTLPKNARFFQRNGIEIVILLDEVEEEQGLLNLVQQYPFINFKIVINRKKHEWRNPCKVLNVGILNSTYSYIMVLDPEVELMADVVYQLRYTLQYHKNSYATGVVSFISHNDTLHNISEDAWLPYGSIMAPKKDLIHLKGYNENFTEWGGEDNQIRRKLDLIGLRQIELLDAKTVHREKKNDGHLKRSLRVNKMPIRHLKNILFPRSAIFNDENWGTDFKEILWDWKSNKTYKELHKYLDPFEHNSIVDEDMFNKNFQFIALVQTRNESKHVPNLLFHLNHYFDGIILLDDGSTDETYEKAISDKLLVKVKKRFKGYFDDLENRNILLRISCFFKSDWFVFIDADERFDSRYCDIRSLANQNDIDVYSFFLVDLWNTENTYRLDMPYGENGILKRPRMFRNKGSLQINAKREIHFPAVPYYQNLRVAKVLLLHYGNYTSEIRQRKYERYTSQDRDGKKMGISSYNFLLDKEVDLRLVDDIKLEELDENRKATLITHKMN